MKDSRWGRPHFDFVADVIKTLPVGGVRDLVAQAFANKFEGTNKTFVRERFLEACVSRREKLTLPAANGGEEKSRRPACYYNSE